MQNDEEFLAEARKLGTKNGRDSADWVSIDGVGAAEAVIRLDGDGDPVLWQSYRSPLSGEYADDYSITDLLADIGWPSEDPDFEGILDAYESSHQDGWRDRLVERARYQLS